LFSGSDLLFGSQVLLIAEVAGHVAAISQVELGMHRPAVGSFATMASMISRLRSRDTSATRAFLSWFVSPNGSDFVSIPVGKWPVASGQWSVAKR